MKIFIKAIFCILALSLFSCSTNEKNGKGTGKQLLKAPGFVLKTLEGEDYSSKELKGKVVIIDFWATWCQPCITEIPNYNALYNKYKNKNFMLLGVTMDSGTAENVKPFIDKFKIEYPIYMGSGKVASSFGGIRGYPTTFIIDQNWRIHKKYLGANPRKAEEIDKIISTLLERD